MKALMKKIDDIIMAATFAEAGDMKSARWYAGCETDKPVQINWLQKLERYFAAIAFAEENCHEYCQTFIEPKAAPCRNITLNMFLKDVGLSNVEVRYGIALV